MTTFKATAAFVMPRRRLSVIGVAMATFAALSPVSADAQVDSQGGHGPSGRRPSDPPHHLQGAPRQSSMTCASASRPRNRPT